MSKTINISINENTQSFVIASSAKAFKTYEVAIRTLTPVNLKYRSEVIYTLLGKNYAKDIEVQLSEEALEQIEEICEINRIFF